jgi:prepilin-type N-terminal cleavage/methylation domain-containing protein
MRAVASRPAFGSQLAPRAGFTLIEVLLAVILVLALTGGMFSYIWGLLASRDRLVTATDQQISTAALFEEVENDLSTTFAVDGAGEAGVEGTGSSLIVRARGVGSLAGGGVSDFGDLQGCEIKFDAQSQGLSARRLGRTADSFEVIASPVGRVRFRYFDGTQWKDSFNSARAGAPPVAVEVALWFDAVTANSADEGGDKGAGKGSDKREDKRADKKENPEGDGVPDRAPDRVRVMIVPDGPVSSWKSHL